MRHFACLFAVLTVACGGEPAAEPAVEPTPEPVAVQPEPAPEPAETRESPADWLDVEAMTAAWAGAQVVGGPRARAWEVDGTTVRIDDGSGPVERTLEFRSPCSLAVKNEEAGSSTIHVFAVGEGVRYLGLGSAAVMMNETTAVACASGNVYIVDLEEVRCETWKERFGRWSKAEPETECTYADDTLTIGSNEMHLTSPGVFLTVQLASAQVVEHPDFASAQAAL